MHAPPQKYAPYNKTQTANTARETRKHIRTRPPKHPVTQTHAHMHACTDTNAYTHSHTNSHRPQCAPSASTLDPSSACLPTPGRPTSLPCAAANWALLHEAGQARGGGEAGQASDGGKTQALTPHENVRKYIDLRAAVVISSLLGGGAEETSLEIAAGPRLELLQGAGGQAGLFAVLQHHLQPLDLEKPQAHRQHKECQTATHPKRVQASGRPAAIHKHGISGPKRGTQRPEAAAPGYRTGRASRGPGPRPRAGH